jgi:hypothetical protein
MTDDNPLSITGKREARGKIERKDATVSREWYI